MFAKLRTDARVFAPTDSPPANPSTQIAPLRRHFSRPWKVRKSIGFLTGCEKKKEPANSRASPFFTNDRT